HQDLPPCPTRRSADLNMDTKEPPIMKRRPFLKSTLAASALMLSGLFPYTVHAAETIKVGILHSLSGTMAISETSLKDMALMTIRSEEHTSELQSRENL